MRLINFKLIHFISATGAENTANQSQFLSEATFSAVSKSYAKKQILELPWGKLEVDCITVH